MKAAFKKSGIRSARTYLQSVLGLLVALPLLSESSAFLGHVAVFQTALLAGVFPAVVSFLQNFLELTTDLEDVVPRA